MALQDRTLGRLSRRTIGSPGKLGGGLQSRLGSGLNSNTAENNNNTPYSPSNGLQDIAQDTLSRGAGTLRSISPSTEIGQPDSNLIEQRMHGGPMKGKQTYLVGEKGVEAKVDKNGSEAVGQNGPELIQPTDDGVIIPNHVLAKLDEKTLNALGIAPRQRGGGVTGGDDKSTFDYSLNIPSDADVVRGIGSTVLGGIDAARNFASGSSGQRLPQATANTAQDIQRGLDTAVDYTSQNIMPYFFDSNNQQKPAIPALNKQPAKKVKTANVGNQNAAQDDGLLYTFDDFNNLQEFVGSDDYKQLAGTTGTVSPQAARLADQPSTAIADPGLLAQFNNQQSGNLGGYSPAGIQEAADYRQARDSGANTTRFDPTNFDRSGLDEYNAQGLNTSGTIQGALPWEGDVRGLNREQISQFQQQNLIGTEGAQDLRRSDVAQQKLGLERRGLDFDIQQANRPALTEYGFSDGTIYPKSGPEAQSMVKQQRVNDIKTQRSLAAIANPDSVSPKFLEEAKSWMGFLQSKQGL